MRLLTPTDDYEVACSPGDKSLKRETVTQHKKLPRQ